MVGALKDTWILQKVNPSVWKCKDSALPWRVPVLCTLQRLTQRWRVSPLICPGFFTVSYPFVDWSRVDTALFSCWTRRSFRNPSEPSILCTTPPVGPGVPWRRRPPWLTTTWSWTTCWVSSGTSGTPSAGSRWRGETLPMAAAHRAGPRQTPGLVPCREGWGPWVRASCAWRASAHPGGFAVHYCLSLRAQFIQNDLPLCASHRPCHGTGPRSAVVLLTPIPTSQQTCVLRAEWVLGAPLPIALGTSSRVWTRTRAPHCTQQRPPSLAPPPLPVSCLLFLTYQPGKPKALNNF